MIPRQVVARSLSEQPSPIPIAVRGFRHPKQGVLAVAEDVARTFVYEAREVAALAVRETLGV